MNTAKVYRNAITTSMFLFALTELPACGVTAWQRAQDDAAQLAQSIEAVRWQDPEQH